jgi:lipid A 3-O-deacylase
MSNDPSRYTLSIMKMSLVLLLVFVSWQASAKSPTDSWTLNFLFENDLFADTDRNYTNGLQIGFISPDLTRYRDSEKLPNWSLPIIAMLPFINEPGLQRNVAFTLGQKIFTPEDIARTDLIVEDRPYAGWLYFGAAFHNKNPRRLDTIEIQFGLVGPISLAEQAQNLVHSLRGIDEAEGWNNQIENEPGIALIYERKWRLLQTISPRGFGYDLIAHGGGTLGNVFSYLNGGLEARLGWNLPADFGTSLIRPGGDTNAPVDSSDPRLGAGSGYGIHAFAAVTGRLVGRDIFLDGNTIGSSHSVDKEEVVGDLIVGLCFIIKGLKVTYSQVFRSKEFDLQDDGHNFGSISLSYVF